MALRQKEGDYEEIVVAKSKQVTCRELNSAIIDVMFKLGELSI